MLEEFIKQFTTKTIEYIQIDEKFYKKNNQLKSLKIPDRTPVLFGLFLGEIKKNTFYPSFNLLDLIAQDTDEIIIVNTWGEMDFLYGKYLRKRHIISIKGSQDKGGLKLIKNQMGETLGYGRFLGISDIKVKVANHILDRGVFLKRDKN